MRQRLRLYANVSPSLSFVFSVVCLALIGVWGTPASALTPTPTPVITGHLTIAEQATAASNYRYANSLISVSGKLFVSTDTNPGRIVRYNNENSLTDVTYLDFAADAKHNYPSNLIYDAGTGKIYVLFSSARVVISAINPSTLTYTDLVDSAGYSTNSGSNTLASDGTYLYATVSTGVVKYQISDGTEIANFAAGANFGPIAYDGTYLWAVLSASSL